LAETFQEAHAPDRVPPVTPVEHVASADGTPIAYRLSGSGDPVLLVHGSAASGADWLFLLPLLGERCTVVTMDRRGRGDSGDGPDYAMEREAEDLRAVLDAVDGTLLVGHSYGALCSILAAERTDRLRRLVLYEPPIAVRGGDWLKSMDELVARGDLDAALEGFLRSAGAPAEQFDAIRSSPAWPALLNAVPALPRELRACAGWRHPRGPIDVPALFLRGADTKSPIYLEGLDDLQARFPNHQSELIPGQRHFAHVFAPEPFAGLVADFCCDRHA
jgi:pimeloyl-ACP methyl ester carboxylesterase